MEKRNFLDNIKSLYGNDPYDSTFHKNGSMNENLDWVCPYTIIPINDTNNSLYKSLLTLTSEEYNMLYDISEKTDYISKFTDQLLKLVYLQKLSDNQNSVLCNYIKNTPNNAVIYHCANYFKKNIIVLSELSIDQLNEKFQKEDTINSICYMIPESEGHLILFKYPSGIFNPLIFKGHESTIYAEQIYNSCQMMVNEYQIDLFKSTKK